MHVAWGEHRRGASGSTSGAESRGLSDERQTRLRRRSLRCCAPLRSSGLLRAVNARTWVGLCLALLACQPPNTPTGAAALSVSTANIAASPLPTPAATAAEPIPPLDSSSPSPSPTAPTTSSSKSDDVAVTSGPAVAAPEPRGPSLEQCGSQFSPPGDCSAAFPVKLTCPRQLADIQAGAYCGFEGRTQAPPACHYPGATCKCRHVTYCGGVTPTVLQQMGMTWVCEAPRGPGECPESASPGQHCSKKGEECDYGSCGSSTHCTCTAGKYRCRTQPEPTPP